MSTGALIAALDGVSHDLRCAFRAFRREPMFAASTILPLALGIGAATAISSVAYGILLRPLPVRDEGSLVVVYAGDRIRSDAPISYPRLQAWEASGIFEGLTSVSTHSCDIGARVNFGYYSPRRGNGDVSAPMLPEIYRAVSQHPLSGGYAIVKTAIAPGMLAGAVRSTIREVDPEMPIYAARTLAELVDESTAMTRYNAGLLLLCAAVATLLCGFGLRALRSAGVCGGRAPARARDPDCAGRTSRALVGGVLGQTTWTVIPGLALGLLLAWGTSRGLSSVLFEVSPGDSAAFTSAIAAVLLLGLAAAWIPAYLAARVDPVAALKT